MDPTKLLNTVHRIYVVSTGAGAGLQKILWDVPGISKVLIGAEFPYAHEAIERFLGFKPDFYCSAKTSMAMAMEAYCRAWTPGRPAVGLGLTASVASITPHRGDHRVFISSVSEEACRTHSVILKKLSGPEGRKIDGEVCDGIGMAALLHSVGLEDKIGYATQFQDIVQEESTGEAIRLLRERPLFSTSGQKFIAPGNGNGMTLFPGAFNPPHEAHFWMAREHGATFHITINPPHKPSLTIAEILQRARMLDGYDRLFTWDDPLYLDKARRFPGSKFVIGADAMERMLDPKWGPEIGPMMEEFRHLGIRFLVADREVDGHILSLDDLPDAPKDICQRVLRPAQHLGLSSTQSRDAVRGFA